MEAPLHHSPVPMPMPALPAPAQQHDDAVAAAAAAVLQQAAAAARARMIQNTPTPPAAAVGREQCPRCASRDTKFCYYNNYNTAQPRHFCRACRRYWTLGGSLRNVPVGGATRKRPRPTRPTRAIAAAVPTASSPFVASPVAAPTPAESGCGGLSSLLALGGAAPFLEGRRGVDLGLGATAGAGDLAQLGVGAGPLLWPPTVLEGDRAETTWNKTSGVLPPAATLWQELAAAAPVEAGGLHHGAPHLLQ